MLAAIPVAPGTPLATAPTLPAAALTATTAPATPAAALGRRCRGTRTRVAGLGAEISLLGGSRSFLFVCHQNSNPPSRAPSATAWTRP
jgi:hypothetical protein